MFPLRDCVFLRCAVPDLIRENWGDIKNNAREMKRTRNWKRKKEKKKDIREDSAGKSDAAKRFDPLPSLCGTYGGVCTVQYSMQPLMKHY